MYIRSHLPPPGPLQQLAVLMVEHIEGLVELIQGEGGLGKVEVEGHGLGCCHPSRAIQPGIVLVDYGLDQRHRSRQAHRPEEFVLGLSQLDGLQHELPKGLVGQSVELYGLLQVFFVSDWFWRSWLGDLRCWFEEHPAAQVDGVDEVVVLFANDYHPVVEPWCQGLNVLVLLAVSVCALGKVHHACPKPEPDLSSAEHAASETRLQHFQYTGDEGGVQPELSCNLTKRVYVRGKEGLVRKTLDLPVDVLTAMEPQLPKSKVIITRPPAEPQAVIEKGEWILDLPSGETISSGQVLRLVKERLLKPS